MTCSIKCFTVEIKNALLLDDGTADVVLVSMEVTESDKLTSLLHCRINYYPIDVIQWVGSWPSLQTLD